MYNVTEVYFIIKSLYAACENGRFKEMVNVN